MCDTLCSVGPSGLVFGKNSDRSPAEPQVVEAHAARAGGGHVQTQYLTLPDAGAQPVLGSRPTWLWGFEHGVSAAGVAIGNEKVWTTTRLEAEPDALIGMDLVRLGLERAPDADAALDVITSLLTEHGQGGNAEFDHVEPYSSSFLLCDARGGWVLETAGRTWAAREVERAAAISNRLSLGTEWSRASRDLAPGTDVQSLRDPEVPTGIADHRLAASSACVAGGPLDARSMVAALRHHGERPWGAPGAPADEVSSVPTELGADFEGLSVCMHFPGVSTTTASMVTVLDRDGAPPRVWVALGSPCCSVYVPVAVGRVPAALAEEATARRFAALRDRAEADPDALAAIRAVLAPVEADLWDAADAAHADGSARPVEQEIDAAWAPVEDALTRLGV